MANSTNDLPDSPAERLRLHRQLVWLELLPGIESFFTEILAQEPLSEAAESRCKYYIERLEILKLPPSIPPRISQDKPPPLPHHHHHHYHSKEKKWIPPPPVPEIKLDTVEAESNVATSQREQVQSSTRPNSTELQDSDKDEQKLYDDIDPIDPIPTRDKGESSDNEESDLYEIPVTQTSEESSHAVEPIIEVIECGHHDDASSEEAAVPPASVQRPPLPPRKAVTSELLPAPSGRKNGTRKSLPPQLPARPQLATRRQIYAMMSEKSEHTDDNSDEERASNCSNDYDKSSEGKSRLSIRLPKNLKKLKKAKYGRKSRSVSQLELVQPVKSLDDIVVSGELYLKKKLTWSKRFVLISSGRLMCYKTEQDLRPCVVVNLAGYTVNFIERDSRHGYELKLVHPTSDSLHFSVDYRDWALIWAEGMQCVSEGRPVPNAPHFLNRPFSGHSDSGMGSRTDIRGSVSNVSNDSSERGSHEETLLQQPSLSADMLRRLEELNTWEESLEASNVDASSYANLANPSPPLSPPPPPPQPPPPPPSIAGYLNIYSSFNKRRWGQRWCVVRGATFHCYMNHSSDVCELSFDLGQCTVRSAKAETKSELGLMVLNEDGSEKITVEPLDEDAMHDWLAVLMAETCTGEAPKGLERYFEETPYSDIPVVRHSSIKVTATKRDTVDSGVNAHKISSKQGENIPDGNNSEETTNPVSDEALGARCEAEGGQGEEEEEEKEKEFGIENKEDPTALDLRLGTGISNTEVGLWSKRHSLNNNLYSQVEYKDSLTEFSGSGTDFGSVSISDDLSTKSGGSLEFGSVFKRSFSDKFYRNGNGSNSGGGREGAGEGPGCGDGIGNGSMANSCGELDGGDGGGGGSRDGGSSGGGRLLEDRPLSAADSNDTFSELFHSWNNIHEAGRCSSELLSERDIEILMQSWDVKAKISMIEEKNKQNQDHSMSNKDLRPRPHSQPDINPDSVSWSLRNNGRRGDDSSCDSTTSTPKRKLPHSLPHRTPSPSSSPTDQHTGNPPSSHSHPPSLCSRTKSLNSARMGRNKMPPNGLSKGVSSCVGPLCKSTGHVESQVEVLRGQLDEMRSKLVSLKQNRIASRDRKLRAGDATERLQCLEEYNRLDSECRQTDGEIAALEKRLRQEEEFEEEQHSCTITLHTTMYSEA
ncbi:hypothetical protein Ahia01_000507500 [Argonauta hians]